MADDYSNNTSTAGTLAIGGSKSGTFETTYDSDWYKVTLSANTTYLFTLTAAPDGGGTLGSYSNTSLALFSAQGYSIVGSYGYYDQSSAPVLQYTPTASGTFYLGAADGYYGIGTYTVSAALPKPDDYAADTTTTGTLSTTKAASGAFQKTDDSDWFRFHADAGQITTFSAATGANLVTPTSFAIYNSSGTFVATVGANAAFIAGLGSDYYLSMAAAGQVGSYTTSMHVVTDDYSADNTHPGTLVAGSHSTGSLDYLNDVDRMHMNVVAGQAYTLTLAATDASELRLNISDGAGGSVSSSSSFADGKLTVRVLAAGTGTYSLDIAAPYSYSGSASSGKATAYTVSASLPEADDFGGTTGTAKALTLGVEVTGKLQAQSDVDMFKVTLFQGVTYRIDNALDSGSFAYGFHVIDASGNTVATASSGKFFNFTPSASGTYYLAEAGTFLPGTADQGYTLKVSSADDDYSANATTLGRLTVGSGATGELTTGGGDVDWFAVTLNAGAYYWFSAALTSGYYTPTVRLLDATGTELISGGGSYGNNSALVLPYTATTTGKYYLAVSSNYGTGPYSLKASLGEVDDYGNDQAHAAVIIAGTVKGKIELTSDKDVFKFTAEAGVTYQIDLAAGVGSSFHPSTSGSIAIRSAGDNYVTYRSVYGSGDHLTELFEATQSADYYFTVSSAYGGATGSYALTVASMGKDDFSATKYTTALLEPGQSLQGVIGVSDDHDWVKVHLEAGRTYVFDLQGSLSGGGTLNTAHGASAMVLEGADGYGPYVNSTDSGEPRISYVASTTGDFYLDVHGNGSATGSYTVVETQTSSDVTAPALLSSSLADGATGVSPVAPKVVLTFDELVMLGSGITLKDAHGTAVPLSSSPLATAIGKTIVIDPHINLQPGETYTLTLPEGSVLDLAGNRVAGDYSYTFTTVASSGGTTGNDFMTAGLAGAHLDGGAGLDTVFYNQPLSYSTFVTHNTDGSFSVGDHSRVGQADVLTNVERVLFTNGAMALDVDGVGGQAYRLYQAAFARTPDSAGLGYWISAMDHGQALTAVADAFVHSAEFTALYGATTSDADFLSLLYQNVLHRAPDGAGSVYWLDHLGHDVTHAQALAFFSESPENVAALATTIGNGFSYTPMA